MQYVTKDQERLDQICAEIYGQQAGVVEAIFAINPKLACYAQYLPAGVVIQLPPLSRLSIPDRAVTDNTIQLWD